MLPTSSAILGGSDDDTLTGGPGGELIMGGDGNDLLDRRRRRGRSSAALAPTRPAYADRSAPVSVNLAEAGNDGEAGEGDYVLEDVEKVLGGSGDDTLLGNAQGERAARRPRQRPPGGRRGRRPADR